MRWENKRPDEVRVYSHDWSDFLDADTITTSTFTVTGATKDDEDNTTTSVTVQISGGTLGDTVTVINEIVTAGGKTEQETFSFLITEAELPVSVQELKEQLRKTTDDEDALIAGYGRAAAEWCEQYTGVALSSRTVNDAFPEFGDYLTLRQQPITGAVTITYLDEDAVEQTYPDGVLRDQVYPWTIYPPLGDSFPAIAPNSSVVATYTAGYSSTANVPELFKLAIKLLVTALYVSRGTMDEATQQACRFLLRPYRGAVLS